MNYSYRDELYHHGIKGQKWGVRRYQNEDGSLTEAGKKRKEIQNKAAKFSENSFKAYKEDAKKHRDTAERLRKEYPGQKARSNKYVDSKTGEVWDLGKSTVSDWIWSHDEEARASEEKAKKWMKEYELFSNASVDSLSRKDYLRAKHFAEQFDKFY